MSAPSRQNGHGAQDFGQHYQLRLADTEALRRRVYELRYHVFCRELGYAMAQQEGREADSYDSHSLHTLLTHPQSGIDVGCIRLVLPLQHGGGLPFEGFGLRYVDRHLLDWKKLDPTRCCEVSRLAVAPDFRQRLAQSGNTVDAPVIALSLYHAVIAQILELGHEWIFMVVEPRFSRHLQRYGIKLQQISPAFEYYGSRAAFVTTRDQLLWEVDHWRPGWRGLFDNVQEQLYGHALAQPQREIA